jgi:phage-related protein
MGIILTQDNVEAVRKNAIATKDLNQAWEGVQLTIGNALMPVLTNLIGQLNAWIDKQGGIQVIMDRFKPVLDKIVEKLPQLVQGILDFVSNVKPEDIDKFANSVSSGMDAMFAFGHICVLVGGWIGGAFNWIVMALQNTILFFWNLVDQVNLAIANIKAIIMLSQMAFHYWLGVVGGVINQIGAWFAGLPGRIAGALGALGGLLYGAGRDLIQGMINGIGAMANAIWDTARNIAQNVVNTIKHTLGISSPSKVFHDLGKNIGQGLANGINGTSNIVQDAISGLSSDVKVNAQGTFQQDGIAALASGGTNQSTTHQNTSVTVNATANIGMYAGMPAEKREIAKELWRELVREAHAHNVQLPQIGGVEVQ